jgi:aminoglycoside 2'-N-acetyltransferase I
MANLSGSATWHPHGMTQLRRVATDELGREELAEVRRMVFAAFGERFDEHDWDHALGGTHVLALEGGEVVAHGAVVPRTLVSGDRVLATGYVEAVATRADRRGLGLGSLVMAEVGRVVAAAYELGALADGSGIPGFYQRLGWETWRGPTFVAAPGGRRRTPEDDGGVLVLRTPATGDLDPAAALVCDWRAGDVW